MVHDGLLRGSRVLVALCDTGTVLSTGPLYTVREGDFVEALSNRFLVRLLVSGASTWCVDLTPDPMPKP
jgi:hypothetical protein